MIWNVAVETMERDALKALQFERLSETLRFVYDRVEFHRRRFDEAKVNIQELKSLEDLVRLPMMKKSDLREHYPFGLFACGLEDIARIHASSGTKGKATVVGYTREDLKVWGELVARSICCAGGRPTDVLHNAYGYGLFTGGLGLHQGAETMGITVVPASGGMTNRQVTLLQDFGANGLCCTPSYALSIVETMEATGVDVSQLSLRYGIFGAEPWTEGIRSHLERRLRIDAIDIYGLSEVMGPGVATECREEKHGLHIAEDHFYVEVVNPETLAPVPPGEYGELVFTSLTKQAFPVIRYRTGDIAAIIDEPCSCGRTLRRMTRIKGRIDDMIILRGVNVFPAEVEAELLSVEELSPHYQIRLVTDGVKDNMEVHVELQHRPSDSTETEFTRLTGMLEARLHERLHVRTRVQVHPPETLPRSEGKAVRVIDERKLTI